MYDTIGIISFNQRGGFNPLCNLTRILIGAEKNVIMITGNELKPIFEKYGKIDTIGIPPRESKDPIRRIINYFFIQLFIVKELVRKGKGVNTWVFFIGGETLLLPILYLKMIGKSTILTFPSSAVRTSSAMNDSLINLTRSLSRASCQISDKLIVYSNYNIKDYGLEKYRGKIHIASEHLIKDSFDSRIKYDERGMNIGFLGRFSGEKGILQFVAALPAVFKDGKVDKAIIVGDGLLKDEVCKYLTAHGISNKVILMGQLEHDDIPATLSQMRLLVMPSYTEGLPNAMLESMACETPVLITPVGAVPDIIEDGRNGFLLKDNTPDTISEAIINLFDNDQILQNVSKAAKEFVDGRYKLEEQLKIWKELL